MAQAVKAHTVQNTLSQVEVPPVFVHVQVCESKKKLSCNAGNLEVSRCHTRGESEESIRQGNMQARDIPWP